jgi:rSAM/selenodomain-associated transferase 1
MNYRHHVLSPEQAEPEMIARCALTIMTKAPIGGRVKTRLTPPLTPDEAAALNKCFLRDIAGSIARAGWETRGIACYEPVGSEEIYEEILPSKFALLPQRETSFGDRLFHAANDLFSIGSAAVCLIGSDSPMVPASSYVEAARILLQPEDSLVLGPSEDGGYYLIGMNNIYPRLFADIDWSTDQVFEQTRARAEELQLPVHVLPGALDIDDRATIERLCDRLFAPEDSKTDEPAPATRAFLQELIKREGRDRIWPVGKPSLSPR